MLTIEIKTPKNFKQEKYSGFITFDYDFELVKLMRALPMRYYHYDTKEWEVPKKNLKDTIKVLKANKYKPIVYGEEKLDDTPEVNLPKFFKFKTQPFKHQLEAVKKGINCNRWFLGDEQGLGKTKTVIDIAIARKKLFSYKHCLIVCGVNTLKWNWVNEIQTHSDEKCLILGQKELKNGKIKIGSTKDKIADLQYLLNNNETDTYFLITNIESFRDKTFAELVKKLCESNKINMIAADEMHKMKNPSSQQTKGFLKCNAECEIAMTGTPLMNSPLDLYVILKWLGYESHAFYSFKNHYCVMGGYGGYEIVGYKNMEQLSSQVNEVMLRRLKQDVLDLPEKLYVDEYVEMEGPQLTLYNEVKAGIKTALANGEIDLTNPLSSLIRLRQTTGYPGIISDKVKDSVKLDRMEDIVEEAVSNNQKVLIFSNWTQMTDEIFNRLMPYQYGIQRITGDTPDNVRQNIVDAFQNTDMTRVLIGTIGAMGTGLTLTAATTIVFVDEPWNKALYEQAVDRAHRIGQSNNITIYNLLVKDSIDEKIHKLIYKKGAMSDAIIDGKIIGNKTEIFNYLIS